MMDLRDAGAGKCVKSPVTENEGIICVRVLGEDDTIDDFVGFQFGLLGQFPYVTQ